MIKTHEIEVWKKLEYVGVDDIYVGIAGSEVIALSYKFESLDDSTVNLGVFGISNTGGQLHEYREWYGPQNRVLRASGEVVIKELYSEVAAKYR
jgi:hypothetical protein